MFDDNFEERVEKELLARVNTVSIPTEMAERIIHFLNLCAGEGILFQVDPHPDYADAAQILLDMKPQWWWPGSVIDEWGGVDGKNDF